MADKQKTVDILSKLFVKHGYSGTSMAAICQATSLGRGSLYHMFPQGKEQMLKTVLDGARADFDRQVIAPLQDNDLSAMFKGIKAYYRDGARSSLTMMTTLDAKGSGFTRQIQEHYDNWRAALTKALLQAGVGRGEAASLSERTIAGVEGALVLSAAFKDTGALGRTLRTLNQQITQAISDANPA